MLDLLAIPEGCYRNFMALDRIGQTPVYSKQQLADFIAEWNGKTDLYLSTCYWNENCEIRLPELFIDFDAEHKRSGICFSMDEVQKEAKRLYDFYTENDLGPAVLVFTGGGYHVHLGIVPERYPKSLLRRVQYGLVDKLKLKTHDPQVFGDIRRLFRIPGTKNVKRSCYSEVVESSEGEPRTLEEICSQCEIKDISREATRVLNIAPQVDIVPVEMDAVEKAVFEDRPCLLNQIKYTWFCENECGNTYTGASPPPICTNCKKGKMLKEPLHWARFAATAHMLSKGFKPEACLYFYSRLEWRDFNPHTTWYQVNQIRESGYSSPTCLRISEEGMCLGSVCPLFRFFVDKNGRILYW